MDIMDIIIITAWLAMAGAVSALVSLHPGFCLVGRIKLWFNWTYLCPGYAYGLRNGYTFFFNSLTTSPNLMKAINEFYVFDNIISLKYEAMQITIFWTYFA